MAERREAVMPIFYDVQPGKYDLEVLKKTYEKMRSDLPDTPKDTLQRWVDALTWVRGVSGVTGWRHNSKIECATPDMLLHSESPSASTFS